MNYSTLISCCQRFQQWWSISFTVDKGSLKQELEATTQWFNLFSLWFYCWRRKCFLWGSRHIHQCQVQDKLNMKVEIAKVGKICSERQLLATINTSHLLIPPTFRNGPLFSMRFTFLVFDPTIYKDWNTSGKLHPFILVYFFFTFNLKVLVY